MVSGPAALVSIHDVMPETLDRVASILSRLKGFGLPSVTLLVVPGRNWTAEGIDTLRTWQEEGHRLAGHGWTHHCEEIGTLWHRVHSAVLSRNVAEHLALDTAGTVDLLHRNHAWFGAQGLDAPDLYVPPAWAMGSVSRAALREAPFRYYETLSGVYDSVDDRFFSLPLTGYEADTAVRALVLRLLNAPNIWRSDRFGAPLRLGIHPFDYEYHLAGDIDAHVKRLSRPLHYAALAAAPAYRAF